MAYRITEQEALQCADALGIVSVDGDSVLPGVPVSYCMRATIEAMGVANCVFFTATAEARERMLYSVARRKVAASLFGGV